MRSKSDEYSSESDSHKTVAIISSTLLWSLVYIELLALPYILYAQTMIVCGDFFYSTKYWIEQFEVLPCPTQSMSAGMRSPCKYICFCALFFLHYPPLVWCSPALPFSFLCYCVLLGSMLTFFICLAFPSLLCFTSGRQTYICTKRAAGVSLRLQRWVSTLNKSNSQLT